MQRHSRSEPLIISAGFPCQDASSNNVSGKGIEGDRTGLFFEAFRIICDVRPEYTILENVPNLLHRGFERILSSFAERGYSCWFRIVSAAELGFPFEGKRLFIVAFEPTLSIGRKEVDDFDREYQKNFLQKKASLLAEHPCSRVRPENYAEFLRHDIGLSDELVKKELHAYGNSVMPDLSEIVFSTIRQFHDKLFSNL